MKMKREMIKIAVKEDIFDTVLKDHKVTEMNFNYFRNKKILLVISIDDNDITTEKLCKKISIVFQKKGIYFIENMYESEEELDEYKYEVTYEEILNFIEKNYKKVKLPLSIDDEFLMKLVENFMEKGKVTLKSNSIEDYDVTWASKYMCFLMSLYEVTNGRLLKSKYVKKAGKEYEVKKEIVDLIHFPQLGINPDLGRIPCIKLEESALEKIIAKVSRNSEKWEMKLPFDEFYIEIGKVIIYCLKYDDRILIKYYEYDTLLTDIVYLEKEDKIYQENIIGGSYESIVQLIKILLYYIFFYHVERKYERKDAIKEDRINEIEKEVKIEEKGKRMIFLPADKIISEGEKVEKIRVKEPEYRLPSWQRRGFINKNGTYVAPTTVHRSKELLKEGGVKKEENRRIYQITGDRVDKSKK